MDKERAGRAMIARGQLDALAVRVLEVKSPELAGQLLDQLVDTADRHAEDVADIEGTLPEPVEIAQAVLFFAATDDRQFAEIPRRIRPDDAYSRSLANRRMHLPEVLMRLNTRLHSQQRN